MDSRTNSSTENHKKSELYITSCLGYGAVQKCNKELPYYRVVSVLILRHTNIIPIDSFGVDRDEIAWFRDSTEVFSHKIFFTLSNSSSNFGGDGGTTNVRFLNFLLFLRTNEMSQMKFEGNASLTPMSSIETQRKPYTI